MTRRLVIIGSNSKTGKKMGNFNLPPVVTCPGATDYCKSVCYATKGRFKWGNVKKSHLLSLEASKQDDFVEKAIKECRKLDFVRLHSSGDFLSPEYTYKWYQIALSCPSTQFCAYTRSWRKPLEFKNILKELNKLPNFHLFLSIDKDTGLPNQKFYKDFRLAYCNKTWQRPADSFRCPNQISKKKPTCDECKLCYRSRGKFRSVEFVEH